MSSSRIFLYIFLLPLSFAFGNRIRDFKVALMYYSEAYLQGATLENLKLEGEQFQFVMI